jgi:hypothetical protein
MPARALALAAEPNVAAEAARQRLAEHAAALRADVLPDQASVRLDPEAQRFVMTLSDSMTSETLRKYPSESQLAYSRAVMAYLRALSAE